MAVIKENGVRDGSPSAEAAESVMSEKAENGRTTGMLLANPASR